MKKTSYNLKDLTAAEASAKGAILFKAWTEFHQQQESIERKKAFKAMLKRAMEATKARQAMMESEET